MMKVKSSLSASEYAILGLLRGRPMHGYEIARHFAADLDLGLVAPLDMSSVYSLLKDLQEQGLIEGERETIGLRPPRTVFHIADDAAEQFLRWIEEPVARLREVRSSLLLKLYFCRTIGFTATARLLDAQIEASGRYLQRLEQFADAAPAESFECLVHQSKISAARSTIAWLQEERNRIAG